MPDHRHGVIELAEGAQLSKLMQGIEGRSARAINQLRSNRSAVWLRGFHDHALRSSESLIDVARYLIANPKRAGLVSRIGDYPYWDAAWL